MAANAFEVGVGRFGQHLFFHENRNGLAGPLAGQARVFVAGQAIVIRLRKYRTAQGDDCCYRKN
jgi:hypothetical protein